MSVLLILVFNTSICFGNFAKADVPAKELFESYELVSYNTFSSPLPPSANVIEGFNVTEGVGKGLTCVYTSNK